MQPNLPKIVALLRPALRKSPDSEAGFTLIEIMIAVIIVGILASIAIPLTSQQVRASVESTVKSDISTNRVNMLDSKGNTGKLYRSVDDFAALMATSDGNQFFYSVNDSRTIACLQVAHTFGEGDHVSYYYLTSDGKQKPGACPDLGSTPVTPPENNEPEEPEEEEEEITPPDFSGGGPVDALTQMPGLKFDTTYSPQNNSLNFCYTLKVSIDGSYAGNSPTIPTYIWEYKIDLSQGPFWGLDPNSGLTSEYNFSTASIVGNVWTIKGVGWNDEISGTTGDRTVGFCTRTVPEPPHIPTAYTYSITLDPSANNWWACVNVVVTSTSPYPIPWEFTVDLNEYFQSVNGKTPQFSNIFDKQDLGNSVYKVTGDGWNRYVSTTMPRTNSNQICYNPQGQPF